MASDILLSVREGLLWEVQTPMPYKISSSPEFTLFNSIWKFEIDLLTGRDRETNDMFFNIQLRNLCEVDCVPPFEVSIFIEDRKHCVQMKCNKLIITKSETLYKVSFYALCKKLSGFAMSADLLVFFCFSSSEKLGLNVKKDETATSKLTPTRCLVWDTKKPILHQGRASPKFAFMNSQWKLNINVANSITAFHSAYEVSLKNCSGQLSFPSFLIHTFIFHGDHCVQYRWAKLQDGSSADEIVNRVRFDSVFTDADGFQFYDVMNVVCVFSPSTGLDLDPSSVNTLPALMDCSICKNKGCFRKNLNAGPNTECVTLEPDLTKLVEDVAKLLEKGLMADIKLKCQNSLIPAHRAILSIRSPVFKAKIEKEMTSNKNNIIEVSDLEPVELLMFMRYLYTGKVPFDLTEKDVYRLYLTSAKYAVPSLQGICACYFSRNLNEDNYLWILIAADKLQDVELKNAVILFILGNPGLIKYDKWVQFANDYPLLAENVHSKCVVNANIN